MRIYAKDVNIMFMEVSRDSYVNQLWERKHNGLVKIITGVRRCGKSYLLKLFKQRLLNEGVAQDHIISIALDDFANESYLEPHRLYESVKEQAKDAQMHYVLLDEIQLVPHFENVLNGFLHLSNVDFVCNKGSKRYYIQSSYKVNTEDKYRQEIQSFQHIHDSFQRILIQNEDIKSYYDENGIRHIGLFDFLLHPECIEN